MMHVDAVATWQDLVDQQARMLALGRQHAAVAGGRGCPGRRGSARQRHLGVVRQGTVAHARNHYRYIELDRFLGEARSQNRPGRAALAITLKRNPRQAAGKKSQIIEGCPRAWPQRAETADAIS